MFWAKFQTIIPTEGPCVCELMITAPLSAPGPLFPELPASWSGFEQAEGLTGSTGIEGEETSSCVPLTS